MAIPPRVNKALDLLHKGAVVVLATSAVYFTVEIFRATWAIQEAKFEARQAAKTGAAPAAAPDSSRASGSHRSSSSGGSFTRATPPPLALPSFGPTRLSWRTPFAGFPSAPMEERYKLYKHRTNLHADWGCAAFILTFMAALLLRLAWEEDRWNTLGYILYLAMKLSAYVPLLAGYREFFISSHRELLVVGLSQGLCCLLIANKALAEQVLHLPPLFMPPRGPLTAFWRVHGELLVYGLMLPFQVHLRMKWNLLFVAADTGALAYMFAHVFPLPAVLLRFGAAAALSVSLAWWWDLLLRRRFLASPASGGGEGAKPHAD